MIVVVRAPGVDGGRAVTAHNRPEAVSKGYRRRAYEYGELMPAEIMLLLIAFSIPTFIASILLGFLGTGTRGAIRKTFIALLYISPWNWGSSFDWNRQPSKRETFFIMWFVLFVLTLIALAWRK
jgi:hypothetical protein